MTGKLIDHHPQTSFTTPTVYIQIRLAQFHHYSLTARWTNLNYEKYHFAPIHVHLNRMVSRANNIFYLNGYPTRTIWWAKLIEVHNFGTSMITRSMHWKFTASQLLTIFKRPPSQQSTFNKNSIPVPTLAHFIMQWKSSSNTTWWCQVAKSIPSFSIAYRLTISRTLHWIIFISGPVYSTQVVMNLHNHPSDHI